MSKIIWKKKKKSRHKRRVVLDEDGGARGSWGTWEEETAFRLGGIKLVTLTALPWSMCYGVRILQPLRASLVKQSKARQWWELTSDGYCRDTGRGGASGEESTCRCRRCKRHGFHPWVGKIPWRRNGNPLQYTCLEIPWTEDPGELQPTGSQKSRTRLSNEHPGNYLPEGPDAGTGLGNTL